MPKLHFGSRGGVYYRKKGKKHYIKNSGFGSEEEKLNMLINQIKSRATDIRSVLSDQEIFKEIIGKYIKYDNNLPLYENLYCMKDLLDLSYVRLPNKDYEEFTKSLKNEYKQYTGHQLHGLMREYYEKDPEFAEFIKKCLSKNKDIWNCYKEYKKRANSAV
jgi:hypothetical protein